MKSLSQVGRDEYLTAEQGLTLLPSAIKVARRDFIGRKLLPIRFVPKETQTFQPLLFKSLIVKKRCLALHKLVRAMIQTDKNHQHSTLEEFFRI